MATLATNRLPTLKTIDEIDMSDYDKTPHDIADGLVMGAGGFLGTVYETEIGTQVLKRYNEERQRRLNNYNSALAYDYIVNCIDNERAETVDFIIGSMRDFDSIDSLVKTECRAMFVTAFVERYSVSSYTIADAVNDLDIEDRARAYCRLKKGINPETVWRALLGDSILWVCTDCHEGMGIDDTPNRIDGREGVFCASCAEEYGPCAACNQHIRQEDMTYVDEWIDEFDPTAVDIPLIIMRGYPEAAYYCGGCIESIRTRFMTLQEIQRLQAQRQARIAASERIPIPTTRTRLAKHADQEPGDTVKSLRLWSCEIEHYSTADSKSRQLLDSMPTGFKYSGDGSLTSVGSGKHNGRYYERGIEIQTALFGGKKGEKTIRAFCKKLQAVGSAVDRTCGLHIHIDTADIRKLPNEEQATVVKKIMAFHLLWEPTLLSFLPANRRNNRYCRFLVADYSLEALKRCTLLEEVAEFWYRDNFRSALLRARNRSDQTRYYGVNLHCFFSRDNLEIRHHSGTLNAQKILEWVNLHTRILDYCMQSEVTLSGIEDAAMAVKGLSVSQKIESLCTLLGISADSIEYLQARAAKFNNESIYEGDMSIPDKKQCLKILPTESNEVDICVA